MRKSTTANKNFRQSRNNHVSNVNPSTPKRYKKNFAHKFTNCQKKQRFKIKKKTKYIVQKNCKRTNRKQLTGKPTTDDKSQYLRLNKAKNHILEQFLSLIESRKITTKGRKNKTSSDVTIAHFKREHNWKEKFLEIITDEQEISLEISTPSKTLFNNFNFSKQNCMCCNTITWTHIAKDSDFSLREKQSVFHLKSTKKLTHYDNQQNFLSNKTQLLRKKLSIMQIHHHFSVQQQELIQQLQLVQRQYLIHQGFVKPMQLDFNAQPNKSLPPCSSSRNREYQEIHLQHRNSLTRVSDDYFETNFLLQHLQRQLHQQKTYTLHEQNLNIPVHQYRDQQYDGNTDTLSTNSKIKNICFNMNNNNSNNKNFTENSSGSKHFIRLTKARRTIKPPDKQSEEHNHHTYQIESECTSITSDTSHRESDESSLCDEFNPGTKECIKGDDHLLQTTSRFASIYCCSKSASCTNFEHSKRTTRSNSKSRKNRDVHKYKCIARQQRQSEQHVINVMGKTSGNDDMQDSFQNSCSSFPGSESVPAANGSNMIVSPSVRPPSIGSLYSNQNAQQNALSTHYYSQQMQRPTRTLCLPTSSPSYSLEEDHNGQNSQHTVKEMDEFSSWMNTIGQFSNITDDINACIHYQQRITGERKKSRSRNRSRSRSRSRSPCPSLNSKNSSQNTAINNGNDNDKGAIFKRQACLSKDHFQRNVTPKKLEQQQQRKQHHHLGKSTPILVSPPPPTSSPTMTVASAAAAPAAAASYVQAPHHNAAATVAVAAAVAAAAAVSSSCISGASMTPNFVNLLDTLNGSGGSAENIGTYYNDAMSAIVTSTGNTANSASCKNIFSTKKYYHPLYAHGICHWPGCELSVNDFTAFVKLNVIENEYMHII